MIISPGNPAFLIYLQLFILSSVLLITYDNSKDQRVDKLFLDHTEIHTEGLQRKVDQRPQLTTAHITKSK